MRGVTHPGGTVVGARHPPSQMLVRSSAQRVPSESQAGRRCVQGGADSDRREHTKELCLMEGWFSAAG